jgi:hypothetical protein
MSAIVTTLESLATLVSSLEKRVEVNEAKTAKLEQQAIDNAANLESPVPPGPPPTTKG